MTAPEGRRDAPSASRPLGGVDQEQVLADPARRQRYVTALFDLIAPKYDRFTRWFSFRMDRAWKRDAIGRARAALERSRHEQAGRAVLLDLACGSGDLALALAPHASLAIGLDPSLGMLRVASARARDQAACWIGGDMNTIPLRDASVDVVTVSYGLRNAAEVDRSLAEIARVLRAGGTLVSLDFFRPRWAPWRILFLGYLRVAGWLFGWAWHGEPDAYVYIPRSIARFVSWQALRDALDRQGFTVRAARPRLLGGICLHEAVKR